MVSKHVFVSLPALVALGAFLAFPPSAQAQLLYCCIDARGNRSCGDSLPAACMGKPYEVTGRGGKVVKRVDASLTPEQAKAKQEQLDKAKADDAAKKEQERKDKALMSTYSSEADIDKASERAEGEIAASITQVEAKLGDLQKRRKDAIGDPEMFKKRGMPPDIKNKLASIDLEIKVQTELIESKKADLETTRNKYSEDRKRFQEIRERRGFRAKEPAPTAR